MTLEGGKGSSPPPPDYRPMAEASKETAEIAATLGREQLSENRRQFDANSSVSAPLIAKQGLIMDQSIAQADDYFNYMKSAQRPVEEAINKEAMASGSDQRQAEAADRAVADARSGATSSANMIARQGLRYGFSPDRMAALAGDMSASQGLAEATAANSARTAEKNLGFARKLDAAGLYRGLPGASTAAYGVASGAGSAGVGSQVGVSNQYTQGINAGNNTIMSGRSLYQQGLGNILSAQTSVYGSGQAAQTARNGQMMDLIGTGAGLMFSDLRLKKNITKLREDERGFNWYEFEYLWGGGRKVGVMAQEVLPINPLAVHEVGGYLAVDYGSL